MSYLYLEKYVITLKLLKKHYTTSRKVAGSNPDEVIGFFN
jgi:hypothetical protein